MARRIKIKKKLPRQRGPRYWMALGTLAAYTSFGGKAVSQAHAQQARNTPAAKASPNQTQGLTVCRFDIPPGPLHAVLAAFQSAAGVTVLVPQDSLGAISSPGVAGLYTVEEALQKLLAGTGVRYRFSSVSVVVLQVQGPATTVEVTTSVLPGALSKYTEPIVDTPQSISVVPKHVMEDQGVTTLRDVLRNVAGISLAAGEGGSQGDNLTIRGFSARNDIFLDGMRDFGSYYRDPFDLEEVDVLKGPSSVTFGRGSTGGVINQETKSPKDHPFLAGGVDLGTDLTRRVTADFNQPLGRSAAFRLNVMGQDSGVAGRDIAESRRAGIAPSLAFGLGASTRFTLSYFHQSADDTPDYGIPWLFNAPAPVSRDSYYGFEHGNYLKTHVNMGTALLEHDFGSSVHIRSQMRYAHYVRDARITEARVSGTVDADTPLADIDVDRNQIAVNSLETFLQDQTDITFNFRTGAIGHAFVAGVEAGRETSAPTRFTFSNVPGTSLIDPDEAQPFAGDAAVRSITSADAISIGTYAIDTLRLGQHWELTGGVRVDRFDANYDQSFPTPAAQFNRVDVMTSWRGAVVYKPKQNGSIYFDYGNSFNPSAESLSLSAANADAAPEENRNYEAGTKWDFYSRKLSLRAAAFRTTKLNAREPDLSDPTLNVLAGRQRVNGMEVEVNGHVTSRWQLYSSYAYMNSRVIKSNYYPDAVGARLANVPANAFSVWSTYAMPWHLELGGGGQFVDSRTASSTVPTDPVTGLVKQVPGYWVFNAMAKYPLSEHLELQGNVYNLADNYYYDQIHPGHIVPGPGRSALIGLNFKF